MPLCILPDYRSREVVSNIRGFLSESNPKAESVLKSEPNLKWTKERNNNRCKWLSIWFAGTEAKLRTDTVIEVCIREMQETDDKVNLSLKTPTLAGKQVVS